MAMVRGPGYRIHDTQRIKGRDVSDIVSKIETGIISHAAAFFPVKRIQFGWTLRHVDKGIPGTRANSQDSRSHGGTGRS